MTSPLHSSSSAPELPARPLVSRQPSCSQAIHSEISKTILPRDSVFGIVSVQNTRVDMVAYVPKALLADTPMDFF